MWTYLAILFSGILLVGVFLHRWRAVSRADSADAIVEEAKPKAKKSKVSSAEKSQSAGLCKRGELLLRSGKDDEAVKCFVQALALDDGNAEAQHKLAILYLQKQMFGASAALFRQLAEAEEDAVHYSHLGLALYQGGEHDEALVAYQRAVDLDESRPQRFISLALVYRALGKLSNAAVAVNKALEGEPDNLDFLFLLVDLHLEDGEEKAARYVLKKILEMDEDNKDAKKALKGLEPRG